MKKLGQVRPRVLLLTGDGINAERELELCFKTVGFEVQKKTINQWAYSKHELNNIQILALAGGFSFGDQLGSGRMLALELGLRVRDQIVDYLDQKKPILGICNGFQALVSLGLLPLSDFVPRAALVANGNDRCGFQCRTVNLELKTQNPRVKSSPWFTKLNNDSLISLPIRHGEGRLLVNETDRAIIDPAIVLTYTDYPNGSYKNAAGLLDVTGRIFGLMPHPEARFFKIQNQFSYSLEPENQKDYLQTDKGALFFLSVSDWFYQS